jgi:hypothetical protein
MKTADNAINWIESAWIEEGTLKGDMVIVVPNCDTYQIVHNLIKLSKKEKFINNGFIQYFKKFMPDTESDFLDNNIYYEDQIQRCTNCGELVYDDNMGGVEGAYVGECDFFCESCIHENPLDYINYLKNSVGSYHRHCNTLLDSAEVKKLGYKVINHLFENGWNYNNIDINELDELVEQAGGFYSLKDSNPFQVSYEVAVPVENVTFEIALNNLC